MNLNIIYKISGYLSIAIGIAAAACIYRPGLMVYGVTFALIGFLVGTANIFINLKYFSESEKYPKGYLGIFLSSLPVLFMLFMIFKTRH